MITIRPRAIVTGIYSIKFKIIWLLTPERGWGVCGVLMKQSRLFTLDGSWMTIYGYTGHYMVLYIYYRLASSSSSCRCNEPRWIVVMSYIISTKGVFTGIHHDAYLRFTATWYVIGRPSLAVNMFLSGIYSYKGQSWPSNLTCPTDRSHTGHCGPASIRYWHRAWTYRQ